MNASQAPPEFTRRDFGRGVRVKRIERALSALVFLLFLVALIVGWFRWETLPSAEENEGYALGLIGAGMMILLLIYPLRKRYTSARWIGSVGAWFRVHMLLGLLGPLLVLYHARFSVSATNDAVALAAMLIVVVSGLIGRFIYGHIHRGYSQRKLNARELLDELRASRMLLDREGDAGHRVVQRLQRLEAEATARRLNLFADAYSAFGTEIRSRLLYWRVAMEVRPTLEAGDIELHLAKADRERHQREFLQLLRLYLMSVREVGGFSFYERLFRAWHFLHLPLFIFFAVTASIHVLAVHMY